MKSNTANTTHTTHTPEELVNLLCEQAAKYFAAQNGALMNSAAASKRYVTALLGTQREERMAVLFLTNSHRVIKAEIMFRGSISSASVPARPIARRALELNAAAIIMAHNHPSGAPEPSQADIAMTANMQKALELIDVRVIDHIIVGSDTVSMADRGLM